MTNGDAGVATVAIRAARPEEASLLSDLALRSKGHWGYDAAFLAACREDLALSAEEIAVSTVNVWEGRDGVAGYNRLMPGAPGAAELDALFVDPAAIGGGIGRCLWEHAVRTARGQGYRELIIQSDPYAEGFYRAMGARRVGESPSTAIPGRLLPLLRYPLAEGAPPTGTSGAG